MGSDLPSLQNAVTFIVALSFATERMTEIVKTVFFRGLLIEKTDVIEEAKRQAWIQGLAAVIGIGISALSFPITGNYFLSFINNEISDSFAGLVTILFVGLLASGTSGAWNGILGALLRIKEEPKLKPPTG